MKEKDFKYIHDILQQIMMIENFVYEIDFANFMQDEKTQYAVVRAIELIGEISNKLSEDFIVNNQGFPYSEMRGMRNRLIHEYDNVDFVKVWNVIVSDLPALKAKVIKLIENI
jgi:uncharacterized protein with HEPN domain